MIFNVSFKTELPLESKSPKAYFLSEDKDVDILIEFIDLDSDITIISKIVKSGEIVYGGRQWYTNWLVRFRSLDGKILYNEMFDATNKVVFIKIDAHALGDNLAWMPYIEAFRLKHKCVVICSTFWNNLFQDVYKDILFVKPNTQITNVYAQYYIGTLDNINSCYSPSNHTEKPLQKVATDILGLDYKEIKPLINLSGITKKQKTKTVCISEKASTPIKEWDGNWQDIVNYLTNEGYEIIVISKEPTNLVNITNKTGDIPLQDRIQDLINCDFFIGVSSGLSWLSWACGTHTFLISDYTPSNHEFSTNCTRIYSENCVTKIIQEKNLSSNITPEVVINNIKNYINN